MEIKKMKRKIKTVSLSLVFGLLVFFCLLMIEEHMLKEYERTNLVVAIKEIEAGTEITKANIKNYFKVQSVDAALKSKYTFEKTSDIVGYFTEKQIHKNQIIIKDDLSNMEEKTKDITHPIEVSVSVQNFYDGVSGILRKGDEINVYAYNRATEHIDEVLQNVFITNSFDSSGALITEGDTTSVATAFTLIIEQEQEEKFYNAVADKSIMISRIKE